MDGSQVGVLEKRDEVCLRSLLESHDGRGLEAQVRLMCICQGIAQNCALSRCAGMSYLEVLGNFTNKPLERELPDEEFRGLLVTTNFTEGDSTGPETMRLLHTTSGGLKYHHGSVYRGVSCGST